MSEEVEVQAIESAEAAENKVQDVSEVVNEEVKDFKKVIEEVKEAVEEEVANAEEVIETAEKVEEKVIESEKPSKGLDKRLAKVLQERKQLQERVEQLEHINIPVSINGVLDPRDFSDLEAYKMAYNQQKAFNFDREQRKIIAEHPEVNELINDDKNRLKLGIKTANQTMVNLITDSNIGPQIWYHLLSEPEEAIRIAALNPVSTAKEIGKIELILEHESKSNTSTKLENKVTTPAKALPTPPTPIKGNKASIPSKGIRGRFTEY